MQYYLYFYQYTFLLLEISYLKCNVTGVRIVIEKAFQPGINKIEDFGFYIYSLAKISKLGEGIIESIQKVSNVIYSGTYF